MLVRQKLALPDLLGSLRVIVTVASGPTKYFCNPHRPKPAWNIVRFVAGLRRLGRLTVKTSVGSHMFPGCPVRVQRALCQASEALPTVTFALISMCCTRGVTMLSLILPISVKRGMWHQQQFEAGRCFLFALLSLATSHCDSERGQAVGSARSDDTHH